MLNPFNIITTGLFAVFVVVVIWLGGFATPIFSTFNTDPYGSNYDPIPTPLILRSDPTIFRPDPPPDLQAPTVRWEYKIERRVPSDMDGIGGFTPRWLIDLGNKGWEVVQVRPLQMRYVESTKEFKFNRVSILLKRPK